jgi:hypothetical protein
MSVFSDPDRLKAAIKRDVEKLIQRDSLSLVGDVANKIGEIEGATADADIKKFPGSIILNMDAEVPADNAAHFVMEVDASIKGAFRFGQWSDMRI